MIASVRNFVIAPNMTVLLYLLCVSIVLGRRAAPCLLVVLGPPLISVIVVGVGFPHATPKIGSGLDGVPFLSFRPAVLVRCVPVSPVLGNVRTRPPV